MSWWQLAGVDITVDDTPRRWFGLPSASSASIVEKPDSSPAALPATLGALSAWLTSDDNFPSLGSQRPVPAGTLTSGLMVFTDMPDTEDADTGTLIAGAAGRLLDAMLGAIGKDRNATYLAALAPGRPATGRIDTSLEDELARVARHHVALARPQALLLLGDTTTRAFTGANLAQARGSIHGVNLDGFNVPAVATFHPRFLLKQPARKADAWADLRMLMEILTK